MQETKAGLEAQAAEQQGQVSKLTGEVQQQAHHAAALEEQLQQQGAHAAELEGQLQLQSARMVELEAQLRARSEQVEQLEARLREEGVAAAAHELQLQVRVWCVYVYVCIMDRGARRKVCPTLSCCTEEVGIDEGFRWGDSWRHTYSRCSWRVSRHTL